MERFPSGQRGQTVNLLAALSMVRIHLAPPGLNLVQSMMLRIGFFIFLIIQMFKFIYDIDNMLMLCYYLQVKLNKFLTLSREVEGLAR